MKSHRLLRVSVAFALAASAYCVPAWTQNAPNAVPIVTPRFTCKATIPTVPEGTKAVDVWLPLPSVSESQTARDLPIEKPQPYRIPTESRFGNLRGHLCVSPSPAPLRIIVLCTAIRQPVEPLRRSRAAKTLLPGSGKPLYRCLLKPDRLVLNGDSHGCTWFHDSAWNELLFQLFPNSESGGSH